MFFMLIKFLSKNQTRFFNISQIFIQGMFLDMNLSKEILDSYRNCSLSSSTPFEVDIQTLTNSHWSMKALPPVRLPAIVSACCDHFNAFYLDKFKTGRRLSWLTHVGGADLRVS